MTWVPLKRVADVAPSNVDKLTVEGELPVRLVNYTDVYYADRLTPNMEYMRATATAAEVRKFRVQPGDVIMTKDSETADDIGVSAYMESSAPDLVCGYHLSLVRPRTVDGRYLHYAISSTHARDQMSVSATGVTRFGLRSEAVESLSVWMPSPSAQRAIADYLDTETARIDALITKKRRMIELVAERRASAVVALLTPPTAPPTGASWDERRIRHVCPDVTVGVVVNPSTYFADSGDPFIHGTDIRSGWIDTSALKRLSRSDNEALSKSRLCAGDVVAMRVGEPGRAAVVPHTLDGANCASILIFRRSDVLASEILCEFLNSRLGRSQIESVQYGAAQGVMNVGDATELRVPVPPEDEQEPIVASLVGLDRFAGQLRVRLARQIELLVEHRAALVTAAVTGDLAVPGVAA